MKHLNFDYSPFQSFQVRTPLISLNILEEFWAKENSLQDVIEFIRNEPFLSEALLVASPQLHQIILSPSTQKISIKKENSLRHSLYRYIIRSSTRCTPYGLFAGISVGTHSDKTCFVKEDVSKIRRSSFLEVGLQRQIVNQIVSTKLIREKLKYFPNTSIYNAYDHLRYLRNKGLTNGGLVIEGLRSNDVLIDVLKFSEKGKKIDEIVSFLSDSISDLGESECKDYVKLLITRNLLINEWSLSTNEHYLLGKIINKLSKFDLQGKTLQNLLSIRNCLDEIDTSKVSTLDQRLKLDNALKAFNIKINENNLLGIDSYMPLKEDSLNRKVSFQTLRVMRSLNKIFPNEEGANLKRFKTAFKNRYGDKEIPLSIALDPELGLKYSRDQKHSELFNLLSIDSKYVLNQKTDIIFNWSKTTSVLNGLVQEASRKSQKVIMLNTEDFPTHSDTSKLPATFSALIELYSQGNDDLILFKLAFSQSAARMFTRFSHIAQEQENLIRGIVEKENECLEHQVAAEIVHVPDVASSGILQKPQLRHYEIPYCSLSSLPAKYQLPVSDLMISLKNGNLVLKSKKLKKTVIPFMSSAHNYKNNPLPIYQFLCDLSSQNTISRIGFDWGCLETIYDFLPRVMISEVIVSKARWRLSNLPLIKIFTTSNRECDIINKLSMWREKHAIPEQIQLKEGDKLLYFNLSKKDLFKTFYDSIKSKSTFIIEESLFLNGTKVKDEKSNSYANEVIIPFYKN